MKGILFFSLWGAITAFGANPCMADEGRDPEHVRILHSSKDFESSYLESMRVLSELGFESGLQSQSLGARSNDEFASLVKLINEPRPTPIADEGSPDLEYDVILQPGHYLRVKGKIGGYGKLVSERRLVAYIVADMVDKLRADSLKVLVVSADGYYHPAGSKRLHTKVFLALHTDGTNVETRQCTIPPSLGYRKTYAVAMHTIGASLATALGKDYDSFRHNYTANESNYYMLRQVDAAYLNGIVELGELSCKVDENNLIDAADVISANLAHGIATVLKAGQLSKLGPLSASTGRLEN
jgi:hypothetical protein